MLDQPKKTPKIQKASQILYKIDSQGNIISELSSIPESAKFVGALENGPISATACLLDDGTLFTPLHAVYDLDVDQYFDLSDCTVTFVANGNVFIYAVERIIDDGLRRLKAGFSTFEYAILKPIGTPTIDLDGGLALDRTDHFGGMTGSNEPKAIFAISRPEFSYSEDGILQAVQYISVSDNAAASSQHAFFVAETTHYTLPGFSGQAILRQDNGLLYAMHIGREQQCSIGIKMSEFLYAPQMQLVPDSDKCKFMLTAIKTHLRLEKLRREGADVADIRLFLGLLANAVNQDTTIDPTAVPASLLEYNALDTHQTQHLRGSGYVKGKGYFYPSLVASDRSPVIQALVNCITKIVSQYYQCELKTADAVSNIKLRRSDKFIVDLGFNIGIDLKSGKQDVSCILLEGFGGRHCHIYPVEPAHLRGTKPYIIDARNELARAIQYQQGRN